MTTFYTTMTDNFMSGWGGAQGKKSKYVVECSTIEEAQHIAKVARTMRNEMAYVNVTTRKTKWPDRTHQVTFKTFDELGGVWKEGFLN